MRLPNHYINECKWFLLNIDALEGNSTVEFLDAVEKLRLLVENHKKDREALLAILAISHSRAYEGYAPLFKIDVPPYAGGWPLEVMNRIEALRTTTKTLLAEIGCTPENDWGRKQG